MQVPSIRKVGTCLLLDSVSHLSNGRSTFTALLGTGLNTFVDLSPHSGGEREASSNPREGSGPRIQEFILLAEGGVLTGSRCLLGLTG